MADPRARRAIVILVVCAVGAALAGLALVLIDGDDGDAEATTSTTPAGDPVAVDRIEVGTCFNDASDDGALDYTDFAVVGCDEPHDNEVFHLFDAPDADAYPVDEELARLVNDACLPAFEAFVGRPYTDSAFEILPIPPSEASWDGGDREVVCALYDGAREELTGSVRGADR